MNQSESGAARRTTKSGLFFIFLVGWLLVLGWFGPGLAAGAVRIYIVTDLEGASGVYQFAQTREAGPLNEKAKEYLMGDIAAVVRGLRAGGATDIVVLDGHGSGAFVPDPMEAGAEYITGKPCFLAALTSFLRFGTIFAARSVFKSPVTKSFNKSIIITAFFVMFSPFCLH